MSTAPSHKAFPFFSMSTNQQGDVLRKKHRTIEAALVSALSHHRKTKNEVIAGKFNSSILSAFGNATGSLDAIKTTLAANVWGNEDHNVAAEGYYAYCNTEQKRIRNSRSDTYDAARDIADDHYAATGHNTTVETVLKR